MRPPAGCSRSFSQALGLITCSAKCQVAGWAGGEGDGGSCPQPAWNRWPLAECILSLRAPDLGQEIRHFSQTSVMGVHLATSREILLGVSEAEPRTTCSTVHVAEGFLMQFATLYIFLSSFFLKQNKTEKH